jgi:hypothetical protein
MEELGGSRRRAEKRPSTASGHNRSSHPSSGLGSSPARVPYEDRFALSSPVRERPSAGAESRGFGAQHKVYEILPRAISPPHHRPVEENIRAIAFASPTRPVQPPRPQSAPGLRAAGPSLPGPSPGIYACWGFACMQDDPMLSLLRPCQTQQTSNNTDDHPCMTEAPQPLSTWVRACSLNSLHSLAQWQQIQLSLICSTVGCVTHLLQGPKSCATGHHHRRVCH